MDLDSYDCYRLFPTVGEVPLKGNLESVIVFNEESRAKVAEILKQYGLDNVRITDYKTHFGERFGNVGITTNGEPTLGRGSIRSSMPPHTFESLSEPQKEL